MFLKDEQELGIEEHVARRTFYNKEAKLRPVELTKDVEVIDAWRKITYKKGFHIIKRDLAMHLIKYHAAIPVIADRTALPCKESSK